MKRIATITKLKPGVAEEYRRVHDGIWPEVVEAAHEANMRNFTIFRCGDYLFSCYEYLGDDFEADMARKAAKPVSPKWQETTGAFMEPVDGEDMKIALEEFWHHDF